MHNQVNPIDIVFRRRVLELLGKRYDFFQYDKSNFGGVYIIFNKINGKVYVGQTSKGLNEYLFKERLTSLRKGHMHNPFLQVEWRDMGEEAFDIFIVEHIDPNSDNYQETLHNLEAYYIKFFDASGKGGYNQLSTYDKNITYEDIESGLKFKRESGVYFKKSTQEYSMPDIPNSYILNPPYKFKNSKIVATSVTSVLNTIMRSEERFDSFEDLVKRYIQYTSKFKHWSEEDKSELHLAIGQRLRAMGGKVN
jgi:hypothetical protein